MNNDELLKMALRHLTPQQIADAIAASKREQHEQKFPQPEALKQKHVLDEELLLDAVSLNPDTFADLSFDRQMMRQFLDEQAQALQHEAVGMQKTAIQIGFPCDKKAFSFQEKAKILIKLHKWWDGTNYLIKNDWLFSQDMTIEIELINRDGESKSFRFKVSL